MMRRFVPVVLIACACTEEPVAVEGLGPHRPSAAIYGGSSPDEPRHEAVVGLHQVQGPWIYTTPFCSGTLIAPDVVLTAAHCLDTASGWASSFKTMDPAKLRIYVGDDPRSDLSDHLYPVTETLIHPDYDRLWIRNDIALVRIGTGATEAAPVAALPASLGFTAADVGMTVNFAGFGETETGSFGVKLQADGVLGGLGCTVEGCDDPGDAATQVSYEQADAGPCYGDSGGPMFVTRSGTSYVGALTSYGDVDCTVYGVSTRADAFEGWIDAFTGDPGGGGGGAETCGDGVCDVGESCDGRDGTAACAADCPGVTTGKKSARYCVVEGVCTGAGCP